MTTNNTDFRRLVPGEDGEDGTNGLDGEDGAPGLSAYEIAVNDGFVGTEEEWLDSLQAQLRETFETVSKNPHSYPYNVNFVDGVPETIVYDTGSDTITKTITFTNGKPTSIELSGDLPDGIDITKTIEYNTNEINISYSGGN